MKKMLLFILAVSSLFCENLFSIDKIALGSIGVVIFGYGALLNHDNYKAHGKKCSGLTSQDKEKINQSLVDLNKLKKPEMGGRIINVGSSVEEFKQAEGNKSIVLGAYNRSPEKDFFGNLSSFDDFFSDCDFSDVSNTKIQQFKASLAKKIDFINKRNFSHFCCLSGIGLIAVAFLSQK